MASPLATVIIPNYNGLRFLPRLMASLSTQTDARWTAVVVDDASRDESVSYLGTHWPAIRVIRNERNQGFAATCNVGLRASTTPFVVLLNNDTHLHPCWLEEGLKPFDSPDVGAVASLVLLADPPNPIDTAGDVYSVAGGAVKRGHLSPPETAEQFSLSAFSACGASALYRRDAVASVGFLDERLESYYEDVDLGFRLVWAGYRCVFAPRSICYHHLSSSYDPKGWRYHFNSARNAELVWWANMPARLRRKYLFAHVCFLMLQAINKMRQGCLRPYLAGKLQFLRRFEEVRAKRTFLRELAKVSDAEIEALLVRNWYGLHISSRFRNRGSTQTPIGADEGQ